MTRKTHQLAVLFLFFGLGLAALAGQADPHGFDEEAAVERARLATEAFSGALKYELMAAMKAGGPVKAIEVCSQRAPAIAKQVSDQQGMELKRVSQKYRNPDNAPNAWQLAVLQSFQSRKQEGADPASLSWHKLVGTGADRELRYMKAIPTGGLCLQCHGENIDRNVAEKLNELYPDDRAIGYQQGDIRGAFVVTQTAGAE
ncbi:MAG: DUF3365 domain-containing protein [Xanthomonadales bacterium]|nr:DUF3365 domain-containing protein [Xanthomonadales bacterium]